MLASAVLRVVITISKEALSIERSPRSSAVRSLSFEGSLAQLSQAREFNVVRLCKFWCRDAYRTWVVNQCQVEPPELTTHECCVIETFF
jgi:hypothetical protein